MSFAENLKLIRENGFDAFLETEKFQNSNFPIGMAEVAFTLLAMPQEDRLELSSLILTCADELGWQKIVEIIKPALSHTEEKLASIGLTMSQYLTCYQAANQEDGEQVIKEIIRQSEDLLDRQKIQPSIAQIEPEILRQKHELLVKKILKDHPISEEQKEKQVIKIIAGPFAAGKSEITRRMKNNSGILEIDLDVIREMLMEDYDPESQEDVQRVRAESWLVSDLLFKRALESGRSVLIQTAMHREDRWMNDPNILYAQKNNIPIEIHMVTRPFSDCLVRNMVREGRSVALLDQYESMDGASVLIKFIKRFSNIRKVTIYDFYPLIESETGMKCQVANKGYEDLIKYANGQLDVEMEVSEQSVDIEVINQ